MKNLEQVLESLEKFGANDTVTREQAELCVRRISRGSRERITADSLCLYDMKGRDGAAEAIATAIRREAQKRRK